MLAVLDVRLSEIPEELAIFAKILEAVQQNLQSHVEFFLVRLYNCFLQAHDCCLGISNRSHQGYQIFSQKAVWSLFVCGNFSPFHWPYRRNP